MKNKEIAVRLILKDLKRAQLVTGLRRLEFSTEIHETDLLEFVLLFMGVEPEPGEVFPEVIDDLNEVYCNFLDQAVHFPVSGRGENLRTLAEQCYKNVAACVRWSDKMKGGTHEN